MSAMTVDTNRDDATITVVAEFEVPRDRLWDAYADPRLIEQFWGPPTYPAKFTRHDMFEGGHSFYAMTGPGGDVSAGYWKFLEVSAPEAFEVEDGFSFEDGSPNTELPTNRMRMQFEETANGSRLTVVSKFASTGELDQLIEMGMLEGMQAAMGQIDDVLADTSTFSPDKPVISQILDARRVRLSRLFDADIRGVWDAYHDDAAVQQWLLGPEGWSMPECVTASSVGEQSRYVWRNDETGEQFSATGDVLEMVAPFREVTLERMGADGDFEAPVTTNELTFTPLSSGTLHSLVVTYPDTAARDAALATDMADGMEASYRRLEGLLGDKDRESAGSPQTFPQLGRTTTL